jgi:RNA polymerase sigma factor (sigma-70 family)
MIKHVLTDRLEEKEALEKEALLWESFQQGDMNAYARLYRTYYKSLYNYGYNIFSDKEFVKDVLQDLFLEIWHSKERLGKVESIKCYLLISFRRKILYNLSVKKKQVLPFEAAMQIVNSCEIDWITDDLLQEQKSRLAAELSKLPARQKEAIYLRFYQELSYLQITQIMHLKYQTVRDLIYKGLKLLRLHINKMPA